MNDQEICEILEQTIKESTFNRIERIKTQIVDGDFIVTGTCKTFYTKQLATKSGMQQIQEMGIKRGFLNRINVSD